MAEQIQKLKRKDIKKLEDDALIRAKDELTKARDIFKGYAAQFDETKENIVIGLAEELAGILPPEQYGKIGSKIKSYFAKIEKESGEEIISKTTIYRALEKHAKEHPEKKFVDESRSESISKGRRESPGAGHSTNDANHNESINDEGSSGGNANTSAVVDKQVVVDALIESAKALVESAQLEGDSYRVPAEIFESFKAKAEAF